jgi:phosphate starvation-inducible PhoH-like protein
VEGDEKDVELVENVLKEYSTLFEEGRHFSDNELRTAFRHIAEDRALTLRDYFTSSRFNPSGKKQVSARSSNQRKYLESMDLHDVVFGIGPAGTGKTYLAVAVALRELWQKSVNRIVLARPAVEAGEKLGFLPGDLQDKVDPYLRPLYDALFDLVEYEKVMRLLEKRVIEIAPLAFMRGRTLSEAFIILDEAQNTTPEQMKMFLTRIGFGSRAVITGDITQIDLPQGKRSGLVEAQHVLSNIEGIDFIYFNEKDVVRHQLVQLIIQAYDQHSKTRFEEKF